MRIALFLILALFGKLAYSEEAPSYQLNTVAEGLNFPWSLAFLPNGDYLLAMRSGELRRISSNGVIGDPLDNTPESYVAGQGGYFDVILDSNHASNNKIYLSFAHGTPKANGTRIISATLGADGLEDVTPIYTVKPLKDTPVHYGGRMVIMTDGTLLMTTGDGFQYREAAQDRFSQLGKTIRINTDGSVPADNPFADGKKGDPKVYTLGHRSPQGLVLDSDNNVVYMHEHGAKGGDEVNIVTAANNYGWPAVTYGVNYSGAQISPLQKAPGIEQPLKYWDPSIAPSGLAFYNGSKFPNWRNSLFVGALVDKEVSRLQLDNGAVVSEQRLFSELNSRIRDIRVGPDGLLYILTDSTSGKLIRVSPK
jgi:glucose/arabinose dehydrogenase